MKKEVQSLRNSSAPSSPTFRFIPEPNFNSQTKAHVPIMTPRGRFTATPKKTSGTGEPLLLNTALEGLNPVIHSPTVVSGRFFHILIGLIAGPGGS